jgi:3-oxoacyl-[acyl-carrier-protein] synthase-3
MFASFQSIGAYYPKKILSNFDLEKMVETNDEWIVKRTGIKERRIASDDENTSDLGYKAALQAIKRANIDIKDIDAVICATLSPDYLAMPSTAVIIANKLGISNVMAFDISAACSGFVYMLNIAKSMIESNTHKNILIIGAEKISKIMDYTDRSTCILFGDGAGASIISATNDKSKSILDVSSFAMGGYEHLLNTSLKTQKMHMEGGEIFKLAVRNLSSDAKNILKRNNKTKEDLDFFIPHQANKRIIDKVGEYVGLKPEQVALSISKYGNTSAASIPMAINDMYESKRLKNGHLILLNAFGGGLTWGSGLLYFNS